MQTNLPKHPVIPKIVYHLINRVENNASSTRLSTRPVELLFSTCETAPGEPCCLPDQREDTKKMEPGSWKCTVIWCETKDPGQNIGNSDQILEKCFTMKWSNTGTVCPERLWRLHPWECSRLNWTQPWATCPE